MKTALKAFEQELNAIREAGTWREERIITTPQRSCIDTTQKSHVVNMCANNYLGLSDDPRLIEAAKASYDRWGFGLSSVRFICGTQEIHKELERRIAKFAGTDDAILYSSCFDANGGLFETLLGPEDAVISDELNHASIIDGVRLCKAKRYRYLNNNMEDLEAKLKDARASGCKKILIATDGVFSMDGNVAPMDRICALAERYDAQTAERWGVINRAVPHAQLEDTALEWAAIIATKSPQAIRMLKFAFNLADDGLAGQQVFAGEATRMAYMTAEAQEGRDAFLEHRAPRWEDYPYYY